MSVKISTFIVFILIASGVFFAYAEMIREANEQYPENYINSSEWEEKYDYISDINETINPLEKKLKIIQDEDKGWFSKLTAGITAIPYALLIVPQVLFGSLVFGGAIIIGFLSVWGVAQKIVTLGLVILSIWAIFKLVEFFNKTEI